MNMKGRLLQQVLRTPVIRQAVLGLYSRYAYWDMCRRFGPAFRENRIGQIDVYGLRFPFYSPDGRYLRRGVYEPGVCGHLIDHYSGRDMCFIDIGAQYGYFGVFAAQLSRGNVVHSFEPEQRFFDVLKRNYEVNKIQGGAHRIALGDSTGIGAFARSGPRDSGGGKGNGKANGSRKANGNGSGHRAPEVPVETMTFDAWCASSRVKPDLVKIDVHGAEGKILFGMQKTLRDATFPILLEIHPEYMLLGSSLKDIVSMLFDNGFEMLEMPDFRDLRDGRLTRVDAAARAQLEDASQWTPKQIHGRRMFLCSKPSSGA